MVKILFCYFFFLLLNFLPFCVWPQEVTFNEHIAPIIHQNCTPCHRPGEVGPFSLISYEDVAKRAKFVAHVTGTRYMPPWKADPEFQTYQNERLLTPEQIDLIKKWYEQGAPEGKKRNKPKAPVFNEGTQFGEAPDLVLTMADSFAIPNNGTDDFRFFAIPTNLPEDVYLRAIEFRPGNKQLVHHSRIMVDTTNHVRGINGMSEKDPKVYQYQKTPLFDEFLYGWVPGNFPVAYPEGAAQLLPKNSDLILNIHYSPSSSTKYDQSTIHLYFAKKPVNQVVKTFVLRETDITNQPFVIPANQEQTFYMRSEPLHTDMKVISVMPHMHVLGKSFRAFAITVDGDLIKLVKIDDWDFNWQSTYQFKETINIPAGAVIYAEATYDNTANNPENPHQPPIDVTYGWNTYDEMMNLILYYLEDKNLAAENNLNSKW